MAFEWDDDGQEEGSEHEGRASIETLWCRGKCTAKRTYARAPGFERGELMSKAETITARAEERRPRTDQRLAVLVPCFNEEAAIAKVVADFRAALPEAAIYVYDNNSTDRTVEVARAAGAVVRRETHQGKGNVVRRMFADVEADIYVLVDGDATYDAPSARAMIARLIEDRLDMVVAARVERGGAAPIGPATAPATGCSPASSPRCSTRPSPTSCPAIACSRGGS